MVIPNLMLDTPPESFVEFRDQLVQDDNVLGDWFEKHFKASADQGDFVQVSEIHNYLKQRCSENLVKGAKKRKELFEMCLASRGYVVHDKKRVRGESVHKRKIAVGVKFHSLSDDGPRDVESEDLLDGP